MGAKPGFPNPPPVERDESEVRWLISYSDFMMQLVCLFILLYSVSSIDRKKASDVARHYRARVGLEEPMRTAEPGLEGRGAAVDERSLVGGKLPGGADLPPTVRFSLREDDRGWTAEFPAALFDSGSAELRPEGREALDGLLGRLRDYAGTATVTGTASKDPADWAGGDAMRISQDRAERVAAHLTRAGGAGALDPRWVAAGGRGAVAEGEARRVTVAFRRR